MKGLALRKRAPPPWAATIAASGWAESTFAEQAWEKSRGAATRWAAFGIVVGALVALIAFAPAAWLAAPIAEATGQRLLLGDARGTVWSGSAVAILTGGPGSRDASALPGRVEWSLMPSGLGIELQARQACCLNGTLRIRFSMGLGRSSATLIASPGDTVGQWPTRWLGGLGTPWNTMQLGGTIRATASNVSVDSVEGRWRLAGRADIQLSGVSSPLTTLPTLGSYRLSLSGGGADASVTDIVVSTEEGALQLSGSGTWGPSGLRFRGEARAAAGAEAALANLLNIIGRRDGARSVISIG